MVRLRPAQEITTVHPQIPKLHVRKRATIGGSCPLASPRANTIMKSNPQHSIATIRHSLAVQRHCSHHHTFKRLQSRPTLSPTRFCRVHRPCLLQDSRPGASRHNLYWIMRIESMKDIRHHRPLGPPHLIHLHVDLAPQHHHGAEGNDILFLSHIRGFTRERWINARWPHMYPYPDLVWRVRCVSLTMLA